MADSEELAHRYARALEQHDTSALEDWVHPETTRHNDFIPQRITGVKNVLDAWGTAFSDRIVTVEDVVVAGGRMVGRFTFRAKHTSTFIGVPATGKDITMTSIDIWRIKGGKFVEHWDEHNGTEFFAQIGGTPVQPR